MAAVEITSVISVLMPGRSEIIQCFLEVFVESFGDGLRIRFVSDEIAFGALSSPRKAGCFGEVGAADRPRQTKYVRGSSSRRLLS